MTNNKKIENEQEVTLEPIGEVKMAPPEKLEQCEWVFQFDEDEPHVFAWTNENDTNENPEITFTLSNVKGSNIHFKHSDGKVFKLFELKNPII